MLFLFPDYPLSTNVLQELFEFARLSLIDAENNINFGDERNNCIIREVLTQLNTWKINEFDYYNNGGFLIEDLKQWLLNRYFKVSNVLIEINHLSKINPVINYFQIIRTNLNRLSKSLKVCLFNYEIKYYLQTNQVPFHSVPPHLDINVHQTLENQNNQLLEWRDILIQLINYDLITGEPCFNSIIDYIDKNVDDLNER